MIHVFTVTCPTSRSATITAVIPPKVKVVHRQVINESHPLVQQLVEEYEYDIELSIEAVRLCGKDFEKAMDYLATRCTDTGDEVIAEVQPENYEKEDENER